MKKTVLVLNEKVRCFLYVSGSSIALSGSLAALFLYGVNFATAATTACGLFLLLTAKLFAAAPQRQGIRYWLQRLFLLLSFFFIASFATVQVLLYQTAQEKTPSDARYLIVPGAAVIGDQPSVTLAARLNAALTYLQEHPEAKVVVSGGLGPGKKYTEAEVMLRYLTERGIAQTRILPEERAATTWENLRYGKMLLAQEPLWDGKVLIVTNDYHQFRARYIAAKLEIDGGGLPVKSRPLLYLNYAAREYFALLKTTLLKR